MDSTDLQLIIERLKDKNSEVQEAALRALHDEVRTTQGTVGTRSQDLLGMLDTFTECLDSLEGDNKRHMYDLLSVMAILDESNLALRYRLLGGATELGTWSHQYVKKLIWCIVDGISTGRGEEDYEPLVAPIVQFLMEHNSEVEAIDFIIETSGVQEISGCASGATAFADAIKSITDFDCEETEAPDAAKAEDKNKRMAVNRPEHFDLIVNAIDDDNRRRITIYLEELSKFYDLEAVLLRANAHSPSRLLVCLLRYGRTADAIAYVRSLENPLYKKQCLYILARNSIYYDDNDKESKSILCNEHMKGIFQAVATSLEVLPPKKLEYMFKGLNKDRIDAAAIANALVHFAYARDPVFFPQEGDFHIKDEHSEQLRLNKSISTVASVGLIDAFDPALVYDFYATQIFDVPEVGAVLALALASCRLRDTNGTILNLLSVFLSASDSKDAIAAMAGIAILCAGTASQEVYDLVFPLLSSPDSNTGLFTIYILGCVFPGDMQILSACLDVYDGLKKDSPFSNFAILGLALFFYQQRLEITDAMFYSEGATVEGEADAENDGAAAQDLKTSNFMRLDKHSKILALGFMHIGTGNAAITDKIFAQAFVGEIDALLESLGLLACCLVGMGDPIATMLSDRISTSSLLLDSPHLRNIVPLCMALLYPSNPKSEVVDLLEKSINSGESNVNSLVALGIVGAGSCSSRILRILDANFGNVYKDSKASAALIYAQGLVNLGKGLFTLSPFCYDGQLILNKGVVGLVSTFFIFLETGMFKEHPYLLYLITGSVVPRYVAGYEGLARVGRPVDVVGLVGKPNTISAAIVHSLPVILNGNERAETEEPVCTAYIEDVLVKAE